MDQRSFDVFGLGRVRVTYTECEHGATDNGIVIYDEPKISIHLTDGLYGVMSDRLVGGKRGDVSLFAPNEVHFGRFAFAGSFRFLNIFLSKDFLSRAEAEYPPFSRLFASGQGARNNCIRGSFEEKARILEAAEELASITQKDDPQDGMRAFSLILDLLLLFAELYSKQEQTAVIPFETPIVQRTVESIAKSYHERLTVRELAQRAGCSTVYLSKIFKAYMGRSVYQYLTEYRVSRAAGLLRTGCSVTEACYRVGFSDCSGFIRAFRQIMGITPYQYKRGGQNL